MKTKDILFWIFAIIQAYSLFSLFGFILMIALGGNTGSYTPTIMTTVIPILFAISTIGIEYLIYSKIK